MIRVLLATSAILMLAGTYPCLSCPPHINTENTVDTEKEATTEMIKEREDAIKDKIDDYADALDKKIEKMKTLLKTMRETEALMKTNQVRRRNILKLWDNTAQVTATKTNHIDNKSIERRKMPY